ncbi:hypothetical protein U9M48_020444 [Paspalum notatum var. saurae]|uniref:Uncharacterized protein n=1 Tax=Paspalum notatum var. saurae TaxID=547442 RepID=A0AAQ3TG45_PASNO
MEKWKKGQWKKDDEGQGPHAVTSEKWTLGSRILHGKAGRVKFYGIGIVSCELANGKEIMNHVRGNKNIEKVKRTWIPALPT